MGKLLRADLFRARRFKVFYLLLAVNAMVGLFSVFNQLTWRSIEPSVSAYEVLLDGFGGGIAFLGILNAVLVSIFIGHEYACGAMRNKVMTGGGRSKIYLSKLAVSSAMCAAVYLAFHVVNLVLGSALLGWGGHAFSEIALALLAGLCMSLAYCAVFTGIAMLSKNTVISLLIGILGTLIVLFAVMYLMSALEGTYIIADTAEEGADAGIWIPCPWPAWVQSFVRGLLRLLPTGQSVLLTVGGISAAGMGGYIGLSCIWIVLSAVGGSLLYRKIDMK